MAPTSPLRRFARLSRSNKRVLAEAVTVLATASLAIKAMPFRTVARWASSGRRAGGDGQETEREIIARCRWAVRRAAARAPWKAVCFQQGMALHLMLRRRGVASVLHYGVGQSERGLTAHVWVSVGGDIVIGGEEAPGHALLASFPAEPQPKP